MEGAGTGFFPSVAVEGVTPLMHPGERSGILVLCTAGGMLGVMRARCPPPRGTDANSTTELENGDVLPHAAVQGGTLCTGKCKCSAELLENEPE